MKVTQSCQTLCNLMDYTVHGIFQARILEWAAFPFSRGSSQTRNWTQVSRTAGGFFINWGTREAKQNKLVKGKTRQIISFKLKAKNVQFNQILKRKKKKKKGKSMTLWDHIGYRPPSASVHGISKQECWSGLPFPSPGDLPGPGIEPGSSTWQKHCLSTDLPDYLNVKICKTFSK